MGLHADVLPAQGAASAADGAAPLLYLSPRYRATIEAVQSPMGPHIGVSEALKSCADLPRVPDDVTARISRIRGGAPLQARTEAVGHIVVSIVPVPNGTMLCTHTGATEILAAQGIQVQWEPQSFSSNDVGIVTARIGDREVDVAERTRHPLVVFSADGGIGTDGLSSLQLLLRFDALIAAGAPRAPLHLDIASEPGGAVSRVTVPARVVATLLEELLPVRLQPMASAGPGVSSRGPRLPSPDDTTLTQVHTAYAEGRYAEAARAALTGQDRAAVSRADRTNLWVHAGVSLAALGDSSAARVALARSLDLEPCLNLADAAGTGLEGVLNALRPPMRCAPVSTSRLLVAGLVPGGAQRARSLSGRRSGRYVAGLFAVAAIASVSMHATADRRYDEYLTEVENPTERYENAQSARDAANVLGAATWAVWGGSVVIAALQERRYRQRLERITRFGATDTRPVRLEPASHGFGLAVHVF